MAAKGAVAPHLAAQLAGRVLLDAAKDNNGGNREPATGNRGWNTEHGHKGKGGNKDRGTGRRKADRKSVV